MAGVPTASPRIWTIINFFVLRARASNLTCQFGLSMRAPFCAFEGDYDHAKGTFIPADRDSLYWKQAGNRAAHECIPHCVDEPDKRLRRRWLRGGGSCEWRGPRRAANAPPWYGTGS